MFKPLLTLLFLIVVLRGNGQENRNIDSLKQVIAHIPASDPTGKARRLLPLAMQYIFASDYPQAMDCYEQSLAIAENTDNDSIRSICYTGMAVIAYYQGDLAKDSLYNFKALALFRKHHQKLEEGKIARNIAGSFLKEGKVEDARQYYQIALAIFQELHQEQMEAGIYSQMALIYQPDYRKSIEMELAAKRIWDRYPNDGVLPAANTGNLGIHYFYVVRDDTLHRIKPDSVIAASPAENLKRSEAYLREAIRMTEATHDINNQSHFTGDLAELQAYKGDYRDAYVNIRRYYDVQDSIFSQQNKNQIAALESRNEIDTKNHEIEVQKVNAATQKRNILLLLAGLLVLSLIGFLYFRLSAVRNQKNKELLRLNEQQKLLVKELEEANKVKGQFFGILSHDLRSPIANLINFLQLRKMRPHALTPEESVEKEAAIGAAAQSLLQTMESMLLWSKGQMEQFRPEKTTVNVNDLFGQLDSTFRNTPNISIEYGSPPGLTIRTDENFVRTILYNLTANAVKALAATPDGRITWKAAQQADTVTLSITDNGPGIREEQLAVLYDDAAGSTARQGLGLHIIRDMAKAIGCRIVFRPHTGPGTTFDVVFN